MRPFVVALLVALLVVLAGCPDREVSTVDPEQTRVETKDIPLEINNDVDILFVIDNSPSMSEEQTSLNANFDRFIDVLDNIDGGLPDVHIGVVTSDMGTLGVNTGSNCAGAGDDGVLHLATDSDLGIDRFISDVEGPTPGTRVTNYNQGTTTLTDEFRKIANVGDTGCGFEAHLASMQRGLENSANGSFLRPDAHLAVVIVADEDDCSAASAALFANDPSLGPLHSFRCFDFGVTCDEPSNRTRGLHHNCRPRDPAELLHDPAEYVDFLRGLKPTNEDEKVIVAAIVGRPEPVEVIDNTDANFLGEPTVKASCTYPNPADPLDPQEAFPSIRFSAFVDGFGNAGTQTEICTDDLSGPIAEVGQLIANEVGNSCVQYQLTDTDPSTPELDYECSVSVTNGPGDADLFDTPVAECDAGATDQPCWRFVPDPAHCDIYPTGLAFEIVGRDAFPQTARVHAQCVVE